MDLSSRLAEIMDGTRQVRPLTTLAIALAVTALVAIPLTERVVRSDASSTEADPALLFVDLLDSDPMPLDGSTVAGPALISLNHPDADGVSFALFSPGSDDPILASQDLSGPNFFPAQSDTGSGRPIDTRVLENGPYELFVTVADGEAAQRTAVTFTVANP